MKEQLYIIKESLFARIKAVLMLNWANYWEFLCVLKPHAAQENLFNAIAAAAATRINYLLGKDGCLLENTLK